MRAFRRVTENNTLIPGILAALEHYREVYAFRVESEGTRGRRPVVPGGTADILGVRSVLMGTGVSRATSLPGGFGDSTPFASIRIGQAFAIETKASHGTECQRNGCSCVEQRVWRARWEKCGGLYVLATTVQQAVDGVLGRAAA